MKAKLHLLLLSFLLLIAFQLINAQNYINPFNFRYYYLPPVSLTDNSEDLAFREIRIETVLPIELKRGNMLGIKPQYKTFSLSGDINGLKDLQLHTIKAPVFAFLKWGETKWSTYIDISPKLNSDFENISGKHFQIGAMTIQYYQAREGFFWQFGLFYNQDTYGPFFMPLFGLDWKIDDRNYFALLLPAYAIYERKLTQKLYFGLELELSGETFRLGATDSRNSFISQLGENKLTFLTEPRIFLDYYLTKHLVLYLKPGVRLFHKYEHFTAADERIENSEYIQGKLDPSFYFEGGLALRFRYDEEKAE